jgi:hypothetical protein
VVGRPSPREIHQGEPPLKKPRNSKFDPPRRYKRFLPTASLTVAVIEQGLPVAYGVVANISEGGFCMQSTALASKGRHEVILSFPDGNVLEVEGRVAWGKPLDREGSEAVYGMEFTDLSDKNRVALATAFETSSFGPMDL